jgi:peptide/nickel transport system substrate-binding protein
VDAISWRFEQEAGTAFDQLETGEIDLMTDEPMPEDLEFLAATDPDRVAQWPRSFVVYVGMNRSKPPFDDVRVRQAVNFAIDRREVLDRMDAPATQPWTCQILPPNFQGYEPFCPFTLDAGSGFWSAPDLDSARALMEEADAMGKRVTLWVSEAFPPQIVEAMRYIVEALNELGMRADLKVVADPRFQEGLKTGEPQGFWLGWLPGYPSANEFLSPLFECGSSFNVTGACDEALDDQFEEARALQATDPAAANLKWTEIEHQLVEDAVWVPLANPVVNYSLSTRVGNVQVNPMLGILFGQLWVK